MQQLLLVFHVLISVALIILILLQQGKGAEMGASFGAGASQTIFGSQGSGAFLMKVTGVIAALFFLSSLLLGYLAAHTKRVDILQGLSNVAVSAPAKPVTASTGVPVHKLLDANSQSPDQSDQRQDQRD